MRILVTLLVALTLAIVLACGGGETESPTPEP